MSISYFVMNVYMCVCVCVYRHFILFITFIFFPLIPLSSNTECTDRS